MTDYIAVTLDRWINSDARSFGSLRGGASWSLQIDQSGPSSVRDGRL